MSRLLLCLSSLHKRNKGFQVIKLILAWGLLAVLPAVHVSSVAAPVVADFPTHIDVEFSPDGKAEKLVLRVINGSRSKLRMAAYSFTSPAVVRALIAAHRRHVDVKVFVDEKANRQKVSRSALNLLAQAGIETRTVSMYGIQHDKYVVADGSTVQTGSFNYTKAAARSNSENVLVIWQQPALAEQYEKHWNSRWTKGVPYKPGY